jgi:hypothetical protein
MVRENVTVSLEPWLSDDVPIARLAGEDSSAAALLRGSLIPAGFDS